MMARAKNRFRLCVVMAVTLGLTLGAWTARTVSAQTLFGLTDPRTRFVWMPGLQGEARATPIWVSITGGKNSIPSLGITWGLREQFKMTRSYLFVDSMIRFTVGRFSARLHYEPREFVGKTNYLNNPNQPRAEARLDYSGLRLGAGADIFVGYGARVGFDVDYPIYRPIFTEAIETGNGGKKIIGETPITLGGHVVLNPEPTLFGASFIVEARGRWAVTGGDLSDFEIGGGIKAPETLLGSAALKFGYRNTTVGFGASQLYNTRPVSTEFDVTMSGWFGELAYYY